MCMYATQCIVLISLSVIIDSGRGSRGYQWLADSGVNILYNNNNIYRT